jgi:uncharacterized protein YdaU (DUF1376 family)
MGGDQGKMSARPKTRWMPMYWASYWTDTGHLTAAQHGAYLNLIGRYWMAGEPLPDNNAALARLACMTVAEWRTNRTVIEAFFEVANGVWRHTRIDKELEHANRILQAKQDAGKLGGRPKQEGKQTESKRKPDGLADGEANGKQTETPIPIPIPKEKNLSAAEESLDPAPARDPTAAALRSEPDLDAKLRRVDEIFPGCGAHVTDIGKLTAWERNGYDWWLDVEPTLLSLARKNPQFRPSLLKYFDKPIAEANHSRRMGFVPQVFQKKQIGLSDEEIDSAIRLSKEART